MSTPRPKALTDTIYEKLVEHIVTGKCKPGEPISELALTKELGVSRTPVHNAVLQLTKDGLIEHEHNHRPVVRGLTQDDIHQIYEMRILIEGDAARHATFRMHKSRLLKLELLHKEVEAFHGTRNEWLEKWNEYDNIFHQTIATSTGNKLLAEDVNRYRLLHRGLNLYGLADEMAPLEMMRSALEEHAHILHAFKHFNSEAARDSMRMHLRRWQEFFDDMFDNEAEALCSSPNLLVVNKKL